MKMESRNSSKKRISLLWRRIFNAQKSATLQTDYSDSENNSFVLYEESQGENGSQEEFTKLSIGSKTEPFFDIGNSSLQTILKKSHTNPSYRQSSLNTPRHATFKEVVKVHEYVLQDTLANEEHYTSEASLTDDDENHVVKNKFYLDNEYAGGDFTEDIQSDSEQVVPSDSSSLLSNQENCEDAYCTHKVIITPLVKKKIKSKKAIKNAKTIKKSRISNEAVDDMIFDFAC